MNKEKGWFKMKDREREYRVWYGEHGQGMVAVKSIVFDSEIEPLTGMTRKPHIEGKYIKDGKEWGCIITDRPLLEYTGLKDSTGKKIFEGDIVLVHNWSRQYTCSKCGHSEISDTTAVVSWQNEYTTGEYDDHHHSVARFGLKYKNGSVYELEDTDNLEIIGNIYETPELI